MFEVLGITATEESVYEFLIDRGSVAIDDILETGERAAVRRAVDTLETMGLIHRAPGAGQVYVAAPPEHAIEMLVTQRIGQLHTLRARADELAARHRRAAQALDPAGLLEVISGVEAVRQLWFQLNETATRSLEVFDAPPYALEVEGSVVDQQSRLQDSVTVRTVYEQTLFDDPVHVRRIFDGVAAGEQARVARVPLKMLIVDRDWGFLPLTHAGSRTPEALLLVRRSVLLDSMIALFDSVWDSAAELRPIDADAGGDDGVDAPDLKQLARLLATGMTDTAIAHHLGLSERTLRRRIKDLLDELRAQSRFQAAARAAERGWL